MIALFTDFGLHGHNQMKAVLHRHGIPLSTLRRCAIGNPIGIGYCCVCRFHATLSLVSSCVGGPCCHPFFLARAAIADWYIGPGNGLFELIQRRARETRSWDIDWKPKHRSVSFHGRDLFAGRMLAHGDPPPGRPRHDGRRSPGRLAG